MVWRAPTLASAPHSGGVRGPGDPMRLQLAVVRDRHEELGFELGLVEAGESASGVSRLEVRRRKESVETKGG